MEILPSHEKRMPKGSRYATALHECLVRIASDIALIDGSASSSTARILHQRQRELFALRDVIDATAGTFDQDTTITNYIRQKLDVIEDILAELEDAATFGGDIDTRAEAGRTAQAVQADFIAIAEHYIEL
jgi:hypothetical protein